MAKRGGFPGGMPGNMNNLMKQAQKMQKQMEENQKALEEKEFTATAGGGAVEVTVSGKREIVKVKLSEEAVDPDDVEMLEDLIVAATNEALRQAEEAFAAASRGNDLRLIAQKDEEFHKVIYMATKNPKLDMLLNNLREQMYRYRFEYIKDANMREDLRREHREITDAIIKGECERAKAAISIHIDNQEENILKNL